MLNLDIAVSSFWQLARHWKSGETAKLELECEGGNLNLQLSTRLGHPDNVQFPAPNPAPAQTSCKNKSPSQLRRQKRRKEEALNKADKAIPLKEATSTHSEKEHVQTPPAKAVTILEENIVKKPAEKSPEESLSFKCEHCDHVVGCEAKLRKHMNTEHKEQTFIAFQCDQCGYVGASEKGLKQHKIMSHRISQVDGNSSEPDENSDELLCLTCKEKDYHIYGNDNSWYRLPNRPAMKAHMHNEHQITIFEDIDIEMHGGFRNYRI